MQLQLWKQGARELATVPTLLGVAAVLSSGAIISSIWDCSVQGLV